MKAYLHISFVCIILSAGSCSDQTALPTSPGVPDVSSVDLYPNQTLTMFEGNYIKLSLTARNTEDSIVSVPESAFTWFSTDSAVADIEPDGTVHAKKEGYTWIFVSASEKLKDSLRIKVNGKAQPFHITLIYAPGVTDRWKTALESAVEEWEYIIKGKLPAVELNTSGCDCPTPPGEPTTPPLTGTETGVRIYIGLSGQFPSGTYVSAVGGPCLQRSLPAPTTIFGSITINRSFLDGGINSRTLRYVTVHEMGHVLGLVGLFQGINVDWYNPVTGRYTGPMALEGWRQQYGDIIQELYVNQGSHWSFAGDVMSYTSAGSIVTKVTIGALIDMGYPASWSSGGPY